MNLNNEFWLNEAQRVAKLGIYIYDIKNDLFTSTEILNELFGIDEEYVKNFQGWLNIVHESYKTEMEAYLKNLLITGEDFNKEYQIVRINDQNQRWVLGRGKIYYDAMGNPEIMSGIIQDITELKRNEEKYKNLYALLGSLINSIPDLIFYKNSDSVYLGCNKAFENFAGLKESELVGLTDFDMFNQEIAAFFREMDSEMIKRGESRSNEEWVQYPDGKRVLLDTLKTPYYDPQGNILGLIGISRDITERKKKEEEILYLSYHDSLTGLYNRRFFEEETKRVDIEANYPISIIMGDVNGLKIINDALGHFEGDELLKGIAKEVKEACGENGIVARWGGDEFVVLLPKTDSEVAGEMCKQIVHSKMSKQEKIRTSISLGFATKVHSEEDILLTLKKAEDTMYKNKLTDSDSYRYSIIESITTTLYEKDHETEEHAERLKAYSKRLGSYLGLSDAEMYELEVFALLHDVGKIGISDNILNKPDKLTDEEWEKLKKHSEIGYRILKTIPELSGIAEFVLTHHERWDGKGYPKGLKEMNIPILARILGVVDAYDAMTNDRPYRKALSHEEALGELLRCAGTQFDPDIVSAFVEILDKNDLLGVQR